MDAPELAPRRAFPRTSDEVLGPGSPMAEMLSGYENRPGQLAMARAVERAIALQRPLFVEAGTGTGKTLAYLVPAILSGRKVIVSTATHALQEQIFTKDLPLVATALAPFGIEVRASMMKGLSNYLCRRRLTDALAAELGTMPSEIDAILSWSKETAIGDRSELVTLRESSAAWAAVQSGTDTRIGSSCAYYEDCFVTNMKRDAENAQIVVVNHHLYCADLALKRTRGGEMASVVPPHDAVVFDEAHQLEDVATMFFGVAVSSGRFDALVRDVRRAIAGGGVTRKAEAERFAHAVERAAADVFAVLVERARAQTHSAYRPAESKRAVTRKDLEGDFAEAAARLDGALTALAAELEIGTPRDGAVVSARRARELQDVLQLIQRGVGARSRAYVPFDDDDELAEHEVERTADVGFRHDELGHAIAWLDVRDRGAGHAPAVSLGASPIELGRTFRDALFDRVPTVVCTSATLAVASPSTEADDEGARSSFYFFRSRLGAPAESDELVVPSPFDFASRVGLYVPRDLPEPNAPAFDTRAADRIVELVEAAGGGAFVLCTSNRAMRAFHQALRGRVGGRPLYVQGEAPKHLLLARFRASGEAILVATMSFWEGVDVPGSALRLVVIDKIPFAVPTDPVVSARSALLESEGGNPFMEYSVPMAAITLKQGFGRLIRSTRDAGVVALLDRRAATRGYGRTLLASLPPARRLADVAEVTAFYRRIADETPREATGEPLPLF